VTTRTSRGSSSQKNHSGPWSAGNLLGDLESRYNPYILARARPIGNHFTSHRPAALTFTIFSRSEPVVTSPDTSFSKVSDDEIIEPWPRSIRKPPDRTPYRATVLTGYAAGSWWRCWAIGVPAGAAATTSHVERASGF
jgi:hypothetical protein